MPYHRFNRQNRRNLDANVVYERLATTRECLIFWICMSAKNLDLNTDLGEGLVEPIWPDRFSQIAIAALVVG